MFGEVDEVGNDNHEMRCMPLERTKHAAGAELSHMLLVLFELALKCLKACTDQSEKPRKNGKKITEERKRFCFSSICWNL
jgi:hypothetical protein